MRISDWSSDVCSSARLNARAVVLQRVLHRALDLAGIAVRFHVDEIDHHQPGHVAQAQLPGDFVGRFQIGLEGGFLDIVFAGRPARSEEHTSDLQSLMRISYAVFVLTKKSYQTSIAQ